MKKHTNKIRNLIVKKRIIKICFISFLIVLNILITSFSIVYVCYDFPLRRTVLYLGISHFLILLDLIINIAKM